MLSSGNSFGRWFHWQPVPYAFYAQDGTAGAIVAQWDGAEGGVVPAMCRDTLFGQGYLAPRERVLVIGVGGGADVQCALVHGARHIDAVDINPDSIAALQGPLLEFTGGIGRAPAVHWHLQDGRAFVQAAPAGQYDQVQLSGVDTKQILASGSLALNENRLYTAEAFRDYLRMLRPGGMLSVIYFTEAATLRLAYTVTEALRELGAERPERHLLVLRNAHVYGVLATREPLDAATLAAFRGRWAPDQPFQGMHAIFLDTFGHETTRRPDHVLDPDRASDPVFALFREAVATRRLPEFAALYPLAVEPVTDDRPFFFDFAKGGSVAGAPHRTLLGGLLLWVLLTAAVFIFLPLGRLRAAAGAGDVLAVAPYFAGLGLGFMLVEIWLIHTFAPLLGHQVLSMAVVLGGLLAATGVGAFFLTDRLAHRGAWVPVLLLTALCVALALGAPRLIAPFLGAATAVRVAVVLVVVAPAGLLMGTLLPAGLSRQVDPAVRAWGLAINFFFSVLGTVAAVPLVMAWGYRALVPLGLAVYLAAAAVDGLARRGTGFQRRADRT